MCDYRTGYTIWGDKNLTDFEKMDRVMDQQLKEIFGWKIPQDEAVIERRLKEYVGYEKSDTEQRTE